MFLNMSKLDKAMKDAYKKGSMRIGCVHGGTYISNGFFVSWMDNSYLTNAMKGLIVKYAGEMPKEEGKGLLLAYQTAPQIEQPINKIFDLPKFYDEHRKEDVEKTELAYGRTALFQETDTNKIHFMNKSMIDLIDVREIDHERGETPMASPVYLEGTYSILFRNSAGMFLAYETRMDSEAAGIAELVKYMETIDLNKRRK